jgi:tetratricopeptide (TPR) repeat protein
MKRILTFCCGTLFLLPALAMAEPSQSDAINRGLWWLYHARYDKADELFSQYCQAHPKDAAGYFYKAANNWWELAQKLEFSLPDVEKKFETNYQKTIEVAEAQAESATDDKTKALAYLYWGGAEGLKGRWLVTQKSWVSAYFRGKSGNSYLRRAIELDPQLYDADMGLGIYDYFTDTLPGVQGVLAYLFIHGDKARGLKELQMAIDKSEHARVEAMMFLIEIDMSEENQPEKALPLAEELHKEFPKSPFMHLTEITVLYHMKKWTETMKEAQLFLEESEKETPYYTTEGIRPARYCLGVAALYGRHDPDLAFAYMSQILKTIDASRWVSYAYLRRGQIYDLKEERDKALQDYQTVLSRPDIWGSHTEAETYIKNPFKFQP